MKKEQFIQILETFGRSAGIELCLDGDDACTVSFDR